MLKPYHQREENINLLCINLLKHDKEDMPGLELENEMSGWSKIISDVQLNSKLSQIQRGQLKELLYEYSNLFSNIPGCTDLAEHDMELESERAIGKEARPCIDYRRLNKVTRTQFLPLPNVEELLEKVSATKYISILDLTRGYWQIPLSPRAQRNCEDFAVPYLDDIAIFSLAWDDHLKHLKDVFDRLRSAKLHIKPSKCQFAQAYVKYLGHLVGQGLRTPGELKVQVIKVFPIPTNKTQCDASNLGIGVVVLSQVCENEEHPIMFLSKKLSLAKQKYSTTEKECAAIIFAVQKLKCYLDGHQKFLMQTDHNFWSATRGLLATDHVILNHGQMTWTTPELVPPSPNYHPTPREDVSALDRFNVHRCPTWRVFSGTGLELVTWQPTIRYLYHSATAADREKRDSNVTNILT
ncbi:retrovirus-related Pol polyprotein from transposon 17.6 [Trichonephila clavipes]|nr:retrovirus-related Pol polyprotein from transposon 17.6 [Trichonephila clavipes]